MPRSTIVTTEFVVKFFVRRAPGLQPVDEKRCTTLQLLAAQASARYAEVESIWFHRNGTEDNRPLNSAIPVGARDDFDEFLLIDTRAIRPGMTVFKISPKGTLHEFTRIPDGDEWTYTRSENREWSDKRLRWVARGHTSRKHRLITGASTANDTQLDGAATDW